MNALATSIRFVQSRESRSGPFADHYLWRDPSGWDRDGRPEPPNNWLSWFGGSAWAWEPRREQFYLHTFLPEQPDVNWRSADLRSEMWAMVTGWPDRGVDGSARVFTPSGGRPAVEPEIARAGRLGRPGHRYDRTSRTSRALQFGHRRRPTRPPSESFLSGIDAAVSC
jgi:hypothetical protein